jgi:hypothetical protein
LWIGHLHTFDKLSIPPRPLSVVATHTLLLHSLNPSHQFLTSTPPAFPISCVQKIPLAFDRHQQLSPGGPFLANRRFFKSIWSDSSRVSAKSVSTKYCSPPPQLHAPSPSSCRPPCTTRPTSPNLPRSPYARRTRSRREGICMLCHGEDPHSQWRAALQEDIESS